jgi:hypothetical protein
LLWEILVQISVTTFDSESPLFTHKEIALFLCILFFGVVANLFFGLATEGAEKWIMIAIVSSVFIPLLIAIAFSVITRSILRRQSRDFSVRVEVEPDGVSRIFLSNASSTREVDVHHGSRATWIRTSDMARDYHGNIIFESAGSRSAMRTVFFSSHSLTSQFLSVLKQNGVLTQDPKIQETTSQRAMWKSLVPGPRLKPDS